jgi:hypothetical protein
MEKKSSNRRLPINSYAEDFDAWIKAEKSGTSAIRREASLGLKASDNSIIRSCAKWKTNRT